MKAPMSARERLSRVAVYIVTVWAGLVGVFVAIMALFVALPPDERAIFRMAGGLFVVWVVLSGALMVRFRDPLTRWLRRIPLDWRLRFVLLCIFFALLEEAVTTTMTNLGAFLGAVSDAARITASKNYIEVVTQHSVVIFAPCFVAWAFLLHRYDFRPIEVFLLYGVSGWLAEVLTFGTQNAGAGGFWVCVYGWMVYLPACTVPEERRARPVKVWHVPIAMILIFIAGIPFIPVVLLIRWIVTGESPLSGN
jgi:hypothetical protein